MKWMSALQIRETWLNFFKSKHHQLEQSASLIPQNDPTLLWINAGVAPLKKYFDGSVKPNNPRLANVQKCIRTNDIDNVGKTARHHTFFEMMGNFSIGDYFRKEAIAFAVELLMSDEWFGFPKDKLYITYYPQDEECLNIWLSHGIDRSHLIPREDNFWEIGEGPCGPDTEIYFDRGEAYDVRGSELIRDDLENERFIEIWNIVFSQYNAKPGISRSQYKELPHKNIDTGAGLERFACVIQQTKTNYETDLFLPVIRHTEKLSGVTYESQMAFKVIADHIRTLTFAISDGAMLSNEGRGYVLRRVLRRAVKYGRKLGFNEPFLHLLVTDIVDTMHPFYPKLKEMQTIVETIVKKEEEKFLETIQEGEKHLSEALEGQHILSGQTAFKLYDTYGFPIELTVEYAEEQGVGVDVQAFNEALNEQKMRSRQARNVHNSMNAQEEAFLDFKEPSTFVGYDHLQTTSKVIAVFKQGIVLDRTPFYATSGGQVADEGTINGIVVTNVSKLPHGQFLHEVEPIFEVGDEVLAVVDQDKRYETQKNHTATHLLHQALKDVLGKHVNQQGSQVTPASLRFDFNHYDHITEEQLIEIETIVNDHIQMNTPVIIRQMPLDEAKKLGAMALFGEKYGNLVRVVDIDWSKELCGGTHVNTTYDIGAFAISSVESIGSGIYRIEAVTGSVKQKLDPILKGYHEEAESIIQKLESNHVKHTVLEPRRINRYQDILMYRIYVQQLRDVLKEVEKKKQLEEDAKILATLDQWIPNIRSSRMVLEVSLPIKVLKQATDIIYDKIKADVLFVVNSYEDKITFICKSSGAIHAGELIKLAATLTSGSGGGKETMAQGGTQYPEQLSHMIEVMKEKLK